MKIAALFAGVVAVLLTIAMLSTAGWVHPPILSTQAGFRGLAMDQLTTPAAQSEAATGQRPARCDADRFAARSEGRPRSTRTSRFSKDLSVDQFTTLMAAITTWVAPKEGCAYCHNTDNLADDSIYAKKVSRRMIQMTRHVNTDWKAHVAEYGRGVLDLPPRQSGSGLRLDRERRLAAGRRLGDDQLRHGASVPCQRLDRDAPGSVSAPRQGRDPDPGDEGSSRQQQRRLASGDREHLLADDRDVARRWGSIAPSATTPANSGNGRRARRSV